MGGYTLSADVIGGEELVRALERAGEVGKQELANVLNKTAVDLSNKLADPNNTPHKSGRLKDSFTANTFYATPNNLAAIVGTNVEYGRAQEYGTVGMSINVKNGRRTRSGTRTRPYTYIGNIKPKFYMKKAMEGIKPKMTNYLQDAGRRIVAFIARG